MPNGRKLDSLKLSQITRVHPDDLPTLKHHHTRDQTSPIEQLAIERMNTPDAYELESVDHVDGRVSVWSDATMRVESPEVEVIEVSPPPKNVSKLALHHVDGSRSLIPLQLSPMIQSPIRSFVVPPTPHLLKEVSVISATRIPSVEEKIVPEPVAPSKKQPVIINIKPKVVFLVILSLILAISIAIIIVLSILLAEEESEPVFSSNGFISSACLDNCLMSLTPFRASSIAFWQFEGGLTDKNNIYPAATSDQSTSIYGPGHIGEAVSLTGRYLSANTRFMNLSYQSWTIEAWILLSGSDDDWAIFGQCESLTTSKCLSLSILDYRLHLSFHNNDLSGSTVLTASSTTWHHVAFVYDYETRQQSIYLDGILEATTGSAGILVGPYEGSSGEVMIGRTANSSSFDGYIDQVKVFSGAKTACQIFNDAILTAYYPFDTATTYLDISNNVIHGSAISLITLAGRVNEAYSFQYSYSYFQSLAFTAYSSKEPFSVSLWIKPYFVNGGTLIHLSQNIDGSTNCFDLLGFSSSGQLIAQLIQSSTTNNLAGPIITVNIWTHIVLTYSFSNGMALYINGTLKSMTGPFDSFPSGPYSSTPFVTIGNPRTNGSIPACTINSPALFPGAYRGFIDELRIYSQELTVNDVCSLFNP